MLRHQQRLRLSASPELSVKFLRHSRHSCRAVSMQLGQSGIVLRLQRGQLRLALLLHLSYAHGRLLCRIGVLNSQSSHRTTVSLCHRHLLSFRRSSVFVHIVNHLVQGVLLCLKRVMRCPQLMELDHSLLSSVQGFTVFRLCRIQRCLALRVQQAQRLLMCCRHRCLRCLQAGHLHCVLLSQLGHFVCVAGSQHFFSPFRVGR